MFKVIRSAVFIAQFAGRQISEADLMNLLTRREIINKTK